MANPLKDRPDVVAVLAAIRILSQQARSLVEKSAEDDPDLTFGRALLSERLVEVQSQLVGIEAALLNRDDLHMATLRFATAATALSLLYQAYIDTFLEEQHEEELEPTQGVNPLPPIPEA